ncbi:MAG TPA: serine hydrolase [Terriglobia bacterium]|nr:serine hydrolase [Terriglobia bacterium]
MTALLAVAAQLRSSAARAQQAPPSTPQADLHAKFDADFLRIASGLDGVTGYAIRDLTTGESFEHNADLVFPTASSIKLAVLLELMRQDQEGKLSLAEKHTVRHRDLPPGDVDPILHMLGDGTATMSLRDVATFMVVLSDNGATNILIDRVGMENVNTAMARLGLAQTHLRRRMIDIEAARHGNENVSTPRELASLLEKVKSGQALDPAHTQDYLDLIGLPKDSLFNKALAPAVRIEDKPGALDAVRCDAGIIEIAGHPFVMCVMTSYLKSNDEGERAVEQIARLAYDYFDRLSRSSVYGRVISEK